MRRLSPLAVLFLLLGGCGAFFEEPLPDAGGRACVQDSECVPNDCCGQGTAAVHVSDGPSCAQVSCTGTCPLAQVRCGCGVPLCRDSRCTVAVATDPSCQ